jgi:beta-glucosidase
MSWLVSGAAIAALATSAASPVRVPNDARVEALLQQMTLAEKIGLIAGGSEPSDTYQGQAGWLPGVPRLGIPALRLADGPPGVLTREVSAAPPATMALAATFSRVDATTIGAMVGQNARARGIDVILQPYINLYRDPTFNRAYNTYGEDPLLTGEIGAAFVDGAQQQGVMAQAKHFIAYDGGNDVVVGEQALHELYLAPFAAVSRAGVSSIMCSYNKINGQYACGNAAVLQGLLREENGFDGFMTSDWGANHGAEFIAAGLDMDMPGDVTGPASAVMKPYFVTHPVQPGDPAALKAMIGAFLGTPGGSPEFEAPTPPDFPDLKMLAPGYTQTLGEALDRKTVTEAQITNAARRVLRQIERFGFLDGQQKHTVTDEPIERHAADSRRVAADAAVLLKNEGILPLKPETLADVLFVGPGAMQNISAGDAGEKALGWTARQIGTVDALRRQGYAVRYAVGDDLAGTPIPASHFRTDGQAGIVRTTPEGGRQLDAELDATVARGHALPAGGHYTWKGQLLVPADGDYNLNLQVLGCSARLEVDGKLLGQTASLFQHGDVLQPGQDNLLPTPDGLDNVRKGIHLTAGEHAIVVEASADTSGAPMQVRLAWVTPEARAANRAAAIEAARHAKHVVYFAWAHATTTAMQLPGQQNALIDAIADANPQTVVVLNTSSPVRMPWLSKVRAVLEMWYSGDEGGWATADILTGRLSPAGRLPFTWAEQLDDYPSATPGHPERASRAAQTVYSEGLYMGYRWFDHEGIRPLFPFGFGLSYAHFRYSDLRVRPASDGGLDVTFKVQNTGSMDSDDVPQLYLGAPQSAPEDASFAVQSLVGFTRVHVASGTTETVHQHIAPRSFDAWSDKTHRWQRAANHRMLSLGSSSRDLALHVRL